MKTYKLKQASNGTLFMNIPKILAEQIGLQAGDDLQIIVGRGELIIRKVEVKT